jgi:hypothetical protein
VDDVLCFFRCAGSLAQFREYVVLWDGVCGDRGHGLGMADQLVFHSVCGDGDGGVVLEYANEVCFR